MHSIRMAEPSYPFAGFRSLFKNTMSLIGLGMAFLCTMVGLPLMLMDVVSGHTNPYAGIFTYGLLPGASGLGLGAALLGAYLERRRRKKSPGAPVPPLPRIDLNDPRHRLILVGTFGAAIVLIVLLSVTGYQAYHFTESVTFCGQVCHEVMKPEFTAYQYSPHARVSCVACHVGPGASYFVRSKIAGSYQLYSVAFNKFPRPIETPVHDLRPAQETCEQCHWPAKFFGAQQKTFTHYLADEKNSPWLIQMLINIGGGDPKTGAMTGGIHYHMNIANEIFYIATDQKRETIPYVKAVHKDGAQEEYMSTESPLTPAEMAKSAPRRMDCVDCHNRPSHIYHPPDRAVDQLFQTAELDPSLPYLKRESMRLLSGDYTTEAEARAAIFKGLPEFYEKNYPGLFKAKSASIRQATEALQATFSATQFPEMKTDWRVHPNHISHLTSEGCFRCHDGLHKSASGKVITHDCNACHTFLAQGSPKEVAKMRLQAQSFRHPVDVGADVTQMKCSACHNGTIGL